ncbi:MAG: bifunctional ADP-heptose synthase, partial [Candidatus Sumerlaeota bacterium]
PRKHLSFMLTDYISKFRGRRILVIGDVIADHYIRGRVTRLSPEAPVPILQVEEDQWLPGGAANVAKNITALGARADLVGIIGDDEAGVRVSAMLAEDKLLRPHMMVEKKMPTILKTRCIAQGQQMLRLDREVVGSPSAATLRAAETCITKLMKSCDGVILSDYGKGFLEPDFIQRLIAMAGKNDVRVFVDPKGHDYMRYRGATALTPNQGEAALASKIPIVDDESLNKAAKVLRKQIACDILVITRGAQGVSVFPRSGKSILLPAKAREVFDVTGAGDTFISVFALGLTAGASPADAAALGNFAGGVVVARHGVATVTQDELRAAAQKEEKT